MSTPPQEENLRVGVIMAGGYGERLWPLSRSKRPKQLLKLLDNNESLLGATVRRIAPMIPGDRLYVVTNRSLQKIIQDGVADIPDENVIAEPHKRNTSACIALAAAKVMAMYPDGEDDTTMAILTADHRINDDDAFRRTVAKALEAAETQDKLVLIGIHPTRPETAYGYVEVPEKISNESIVSETLPVLRFREKPNKEVAEEFISTGRFFWNSGMFFWKLSVFLQELDEAMPTLAMATREMAECFRRDTEDSMKRLSRIFEGLGDISIDYGLMEKSSSVVLIPAQFSWDDLGSWDSLRRAWEKDRHGNISKGGSVLVDTHDSVIYNAEEPGELIVAVLGMRDVTVVGTQDAILVCPTDRAQEIRKIIRILREEYPEHL